VLETKDFQVVTVQSGAAGLKEFEKAEFDLVIVDIISPLTPVIVASGFMFGGSCPEMPNFEAMAMEAGAMAVQYKPIRPKGFLKAVQKAIDMAA
jgi:AmiR/NasT family two-component response regulator